MVDHRVLFKAPHRGMFRTLQCLLVLSFLTSDPRQVTGEAQEVEGSGRQSPRSMVDAYVLFHTRQEFH